MSKIPKPFAVTEFKRSGITLHIHSPMPVNPYVKIIKLLKYSLGHNYFTCTFIIYEKYLSHTRAHTQTLQEGLQEVLGFRNSSLARVVKARPFLKCRILPSLT